MNNTKIISFQAHLDDSYFLGIENIVEENSDFGAFWGNFFDKGGYDKIEPYQTDPNCVNIWFYNDSGKIYMQGKFVNVKQIDQVPQDYSLKKFPAGDYLVVTTNWLSSYEESMNHINPDYYKNAEIPEGYKKCSKTDCDIFLIERWGADTGNGYRYEFWLPIKKIK